MKAYEIVWKHMKAYMKAYGRILTVYERVQKGIMWSYVINTCTSVIRPKKCASLGVSNKRNSIRDKEAKES